MRIKWVAVAALVSAFLAPAVGAKDRALIVDLSNYKHLRDLPGDGRINAMRNRLIAEGFEVDRLDNPTLSRMRAAVFALEAATQGEPGRTIVVLRGHIVNDGDRTWLMSQGGRTPDRFDLGSKALPLYLLDNALSAAAGSAVLALVPSPRPLDGLVDLVNGVGTLDLPQGVTAISGSSRRVQSAINNLMQPGSTTGSLAQDGLAVAGYVSETTSFTPDQGQPPEDIGELAYWSAVRDIGTPEAFEAYLNRYPDGLFAEEAAQTIIGDEQNREAAIKQAETDLRLNRSRRQEIQRSLALLGYDPRGIDGVFGPATRRAIAAWQSDNRLEAHGFLDRDQLFLLQEVAARRAAELEEEARRRRLVEEARDRAYWNSTGVSGLEEDYRLYLNRYPDGIFADIARDAIADFEAERRAELNERERAAWDRAEAENTVDAYRSFLGSYPDGELAETANARISDLEGAAKNEELRARYQAVENSVARNSATRLLIEGRLQGMGLEPGAVDGNFDNSTRRALRRFQKARGLTVTGYVDQATMVRLLLGG
ncbi:MAG: peptidoglycan-binding domain-containing protein [Cognatishimia sp.]|uniref:peptidoglycan-binding domain-containing protein n=1 Tax=Cognatishimia sp. TaxID=2211648 RepID=UPI0040596BBE